jgi:hypothetical protein
MLLVVRSLFKWVSFGHPFHHFSRMALVYLGDVPLSQSLILLHRLRRTRRRPAKSSHFSPIDLVRLRSRRCWSCDDPKRKDTRIPFLTSIPGYDPLLIVCREVSLRLILQLRCLELRRYNRMMHNMRSINRINRRHPNIVSLLPPILYPFQFLQGPKPPGKRAENSPIIQAQRKILIQQVRTLRAPHTHNLPLLPHHPRLLEHRTNVPTHSPKCRMGLADPILIICETQVNGCSCFRNSFAGRRL